MDGNNLDNSKNRSSPAMIHKKEKGIISIDRDASFFQKKRPQMRRLKSKKEQQAERIGRIVEDQTKMKQVYGESVKKLFSTGPVEQPIDMTLEGFQRIYGSPKQKKTEFEKQTSRKTDLTNPLNENRFENINVFPAISSKHRVPPCNFNFDKQVSRTKYHQAFIQKQEDHKVDANAYNINLSLTRERSKVAILDPDAEQIRKMKAQARLMQSVQLRGKQKDSQKLLETPEVRKLQQRFSRKTLHKNRDYISSTQASQRKLEIADDGEIIYEGDHGALDAIFPSDGIIRIKKAPPSVNGESPEKIKKMLKDHNAPIEKQRVILKPKKHKLPIGYDILDEETFSDVLYDSDRDQKSPKKKK